MAEQVKEQDNIKFDQKKITIKVQSTPAYTDDMRKNLLRGWYANLGYNRYYLKSQLHSQTNQIQKMTLNGFFDAFYAAYCLHGEVQLSADHIWILICNRVNNYVLNNPEECRHYFVEHKEKEILSYSIDLTSPEYLNFPCKDNNWEAIAEGFREKMKNQVKGEIAELFRNNFSTSDPVFRASADIYLMSTMQNYFSYLLMGGGCGIQKVHFEGEVADYEKLYEKIVQLKKNYPLSPDFVDNLEEIEKVVAKFVEQIKNPDEVDKQFWNSAFYSKKEQGMGGSGEITEIEVFSGWITKFFGGRKMTRDSVPICRAKAPVTFVDLLKNITMELSFETELHGIEEIAPKVFRPVVSIAFVEATDY